MLPLLETLALGLVRLIGLSIFLIMQDVAQRLQTSGLQLNVTSSRLGKLLNDLKSTRQMNEPKETPVDLQPAQIEMEVLFHKNQLHDRIKKEFIDSTIDFRSIFNEIGIDQKFGFDLLVQMVLHKRVNVPTLVGILRKHYNGNVQQTADACLKAAMADLLDWSQPTEVFIVRYDISDDVREEIDTYQYPMPMIVEPRQLKTNRDTGYFTNKDSVILRNNHHDDDVCLDYLNKINQVKLRVNTDTVAFIQNQWKNLDKCKPDETRQDFMKRKKAFEKYDRTSREVLAHLEIAGSEFWLTHKYDKRGRVYCQGYHVTYQGNDWNKACIEFAEGEALE